MVNHPPPLLKPQLFSVGAFSRPIATVPACFRGFTRIAADFAVWPSGPFSAAFRSLLAILLPGFALREWPEVRREPVWLLLKSTGYTRTDQGGWIASLPTRRGQRRSRKRADPAQRALARLPEPGALVIPQRWRIHRQVKQRDVVGQGVVEDVHPLQRATGPGRYRALSGQ